MSEVTRAAATAAPAALVLRRLDLGATGDPAVDRERDGLVRRGAVPDPAVRDAVRAILAGIRVNPDAAVAAANSRFGGGLADGRLLIGRAEMAAARDALGPEIRAALEHSIANVRRFAETQRPSSTVTEIAPGIEIERRWLPLDRVGVYVPGGTAPYPSSLIMGVVPARVAGVGHVAVASPAGPDGRVNAALLGAAGLLEVDAFVVAGGAQGVGALAYGLPGAGLLPVDRIVGPGNAWVTAAKIELVGEVGIDLPAGPSEGMILADDSADPVRVAADLITQAEHGPDSPALLVTSSEALAQAVEAELVRQLPDLARGDTLARSLAAAGTIVLTADIAEALAFADEYAPEHLSCVVADPDAALAALRHAGSLFLGAYAPESAGDYAAGSNHVLPTAGAGRAYSPLGVESFGRWMQVNRITREGLARIAPTVATVAEAEGLTAHRRAVEIRFEGGS